jgi:hypothetical protein
VAVMPKAWAGSLPRYPISDAGLVVGIWFLIGIIYRAFLLRRYPERVRDMDKVFD